MAQKLQIFAVFDKKAIAYAYPTFAHQKGQAIRSFENAVNDDKTQFAHNPEDFSLWHLGEWDDVTGIITPLTAPQHIEEALTLKRT